MNADFLSVQSVSSVVKILRANDPFVWARVASRGNSYESVSHHYRHGVRVDHSGAHRTFLRGRIAPNEGADVHGVDRRGSCAVFLGVDVAAAFISLITEVRMNPDALSAVPLGLNV